MKPVRGAPLSSACFFLVMVAVLSGIHPAWAADPFIPAVQKQIEQRIKAEAGKKTFVCYTELICGVTLVPAFYSGRGFIPAWVDPDGSMPLADQLMSAIEDAGRDGLDPEVYHLSVLRKMTALTRSTDRDGFFETAALFADLDILLTDAFLLFGSHLLGGRVNPETVHTGWFVTAHHADLAQRIEVALKSRQIQGELDKLTPPHVAYTGLRDRLAAYRALAAKGGWPSIPPGATLRPGEQGGRVERARKRLLASGDLDPDPALHLPAVFDEAMEQAVRRFQRRHGLVPDGAVGSRTIDVMNVPVEVRVRQIELNMERWRWLPQWLGDRYLVVNIADFSLALVEDGRETLKMRAVVGRPYRKTPVFSADMTYLVLNPYWNIPGTIAVQDMLPAIQRGTGFLEKNRIRVFADWSEGAPELAADSIDWQAVGGHYFPYKLRQNPGPENALGRIKFMFPNKFAVYIHDTPHRALFDETVRGFSSGCIRVEQPVLLANRLLENQPEWSAERLAGVLEGGETTEIRLKEPVPVHLLYLTAWIDDKGLLNFRDDIYERDSPLDAALKEKAPRAALFSNPKPLTSTVNDS